MLYAPPLQPHDVDPALLKPRKQKTDSECPSIASSSPAVAAENNVVGGGHTTKQLDTNKTPQSSNKSKRQSSKSPATVIATTTTTMPIRTAASPKIVSLEICLIRSYLFYAHFFSLLLADPQRETFAFGKCFEIPQTTSKTYKTNGKQ